MESSTRLEELLHRHGEMSAASSHAALYLYGQELPLNSSIASHNLEDGVIIESCKSPNMSAAISAVLRDLDRVKKTIQEGDRKKETLGFLEVPNEYLQDNGEDAIFWQTERWSNDSLKNRTICLAIMKKILQRDDRYSIHDLPSCTDCHSLHQNIQGILPSRNGYLFTPSTKRDGKPSTVWVLLQQKVRRQIEVAASFRKDGGENSSIQLLVMSLQGLLGGEEEINHKLLGEKMSAMHLHHVLERRVHRVQGNLTVHNMRRAHLQFSALYLRRWKEITEIPMGDAS